MSQPPDPKLPPGVYWAHKRWDARRERYDYYHASPSLFFVQASGMPGVHIVKVRLSERAASDPPSDLWGWEYEEGSIYGKPGEYHMVWPHRGLFSICFPYDPFHPPSRVGGRAVNLNVEELEDV